MRTSITIFLFLMGFILGKLGETQPQNNINMVGEPLQKRVENPQLIRVPMENNSSLIRWPVENGEWVTKRVVSREAQMRVYAADGTYILASLEDWLNNTDVGVEFSSKNWRVEK